MYQLKLNGYFELEDPSGFLEELEELKKKYDAYFFGHPVLQDLGHYVDFQKVEAVTVESTEDESVTTPESDEKV